MQHDRHFRFSQDWFSHHIPAWNKILPLLRPSRVLEIGSYEGRATSYMIETCCAFGPLQITCVDTWAGAADLSDTMMAGVEARFDENTRLAIDVAHAPVSLRKIKQPSAIALAGFVASGEPQFDLIYVDGSHTAPDVLIDAVLAFQLLRVGGIMIFDDYLWTLEPQASVDALNLPKPAVDAFANIFMRKVRLIAGMPNAQCYLEKIAA